MAQLLSVIIALSLPILIAAEAYPCVQRATDYGYVCVCNSTYCDTIPAVLNLTSGEYQWYSTSANKLGFNSASGNFTNSSSTSDATITVTNLNATGPAILGFGGAFTDATGINLINLSNGSQENWLQAHFGEEGIEYTFIRVPLGATDYSLTWYTYADDEDVTLSNFSLQTGDLLYKIPFLQKAFELRGNSSLNLYGSAWTAPKWMKTNNAYAGQSVIEDKYLDIWAQYYIKFLEAYSEHNISFWGLTTQNEPVDGVYGSGIPNNGFNTTKIITWVKNHFGPAIRNSSFSDIKIILHDDQTTVLPSFYELVLSDEDVINYADGIGIHWYMNALVPQDFLNFASNNVANSTKELFRLGTEACNGYQYDLGLDESAVELGSWKRGDLYLKDIIVDLSYNFVGWVDWNMALNETGNGMVLSTGEYIDTLGLDAPTIVNATADEFYKQPMFYVLGHFSKFILPGSQRIDSTITGDGVNGIAFLRPDGKVAVVIRNRLANSQLVTLEIVNRTEVFNVTAQSVNTILYCVQGGLT